MKLKKVLALLLALVMVFALVACGKDSKSDDSKKEEEKPLSEQIVGTWTSTIKVSGVKLQLPTYDGTLELKVEYIFKADGNCSAKGDEAAYQANVEANRAALGEAIIQMLVNQMGSRDAAAAQVEAEMGKTLEEYGNWFVDELKSQMPDMSEEGTWKLEGNKLTMGETAYDISIKDNTMTWTGNEEMTETLGVESIVLTRVN